MQELINVPMDISSGGGFTKLADDGSFTFHFASKHKDENQKLTDFHYSMSFMQDIIEFMNKHQQFVPLVLHDIEEILMETN